MVEGLGARTRRTSILTCVRIRPWLGAFGIRKPDLVVWGGLATDFHRLHRERTIATTRVLLHRRKYEALVSGRQITRHLGTEGISIMIGVGTSSLARHVRHCPTCSSQSTGYSKMPMSWPLCIANMALRV